MKVPWLTGLFLILSVALTAQSRPALADGFDTIHLGMSLAELKTALGQSGYFLWKGDPDVSLLAKPNTSLIDVAGIDYFSRGVFQLENGKLFIASFDLNPDHFDYFGVYTALVKKYGDPVSLDPGMAKWEDGKTRLTLERPLTIKYVDIVTQSTIIQKAESGKAYQEISREKFLELF